MNEPATRWECKPQIHGGKIMATTTIDTIAPLPQIFSRWYLLFMGFALTVFGIALLVAALELPGVQGYLSGPGILFLYTAAIVLAIGFFIRREAVVRTTAGTIGILYFAWGVVFLFIGPNYRDGTMAVLVTVMGIFLIVAGALGMASAFIPALWFRHRQPL